MNSTVALLVRLKFSIFERIFVLTDSFLDCYDTELVDESWNHTWHTWLAVITSDRFFEVEDWNDDYRRTAFGEKITSFTE
jgi:hypothetical protein